MRLCSACFLGVRCLWNRASRPNKKILELSKKEILIPICPEQLGGLATPREPCKVVGNQVFTRSGKDVTENFYRGAQEALRIAKFYGITEAILKQGSPSCGPATTGPLRKGEGVTAKLFRQNGIKVISQGQIR